MDRPAMGGLRAANGGGWFSRVGWAWLPAVLLAVSAQAQTVPVATPQDYVTAIDAANASGGTAVAVDAVLGTVVSLSGATLPALTSGTLQIGDGATDTQIAGGQIVNNAAVVFMAPFQSFDTMSTSISGSGSLTVTSTPGYGANAVLTFSGSSSYTGGTTVNGNTSLGSGNGGIALQYASESALLPAGSVTLLNYGGIAAAYAMDQATLNTLATASVGFAALGADSANNLDFTNLPQVSLGAVATQPYMPTPVTYSGTITPTPPSAASLSTSNAQYQFGGGNGILIVSSNLTDPVRGMAELDVTGHGYTVLTGVNTFSGNINISSGVLQLATPAAFCGIATSGCTAQVPGQIQINAAGILAVSYPLDSATLYAIAAGSTGIVAVGANTSNPIDMSSLPGVSLGAVGTAIGPGDSFASASGYTVSGTIRAAGTAYLLGGGGSGFAFAQNNTLTVSSVLGDGDGYAIGLNVDSNPNSSGSVVLSALNQFSGPTVIGIASPNLNGVLYLGDGTNDGNIDTSASVTNYGDLEFNEGSAQTFDPPVGGPGLLFQIGPGQVTLTAAETYTGSTYIYSGMLALSGSGSIAASNQVQIASAYPGGVPAGLDISQASGNETVNNLNSFWSCSGACSGTSSATVVLGANTLTDIASKAATFDGAISGTGGFVKQGAATLTLAGNNSYSGGTAIAAGTLQLGGQAPGAPAATVGTLGSGPVANNAALVFSEPSGVTFANAFSGTGTMTQSGPGTITLTGSGRSTGLTEVAAGTLIVGPSAGGSATVGGAVQVDAGATLSGYGSVAIISLGTLTNNGTVIPGGAAVTAPGVLTDLGNYVQGGGGTLVIDVTPAQASELKVRGAATLAGTISFVYAPGSYVPATYPVLSTLGTISGTFGKVLESGAIPAALTRSVTYAAGAVTDGTVNLVLAKSSVVAPAAANIFSEQLASLTGLSDAGAATLLDGGSANDCATAAMPQASAQPGAPAQASAGMAAIGRILCDAGGWIRADGAFRAVQAGGGDPGYHADTTGFLAGIDRPVGDSGLRVGFAAGYDHRWLADSVGANATADVVRLGVYVIKQAGPVVLNAALLYGHDWEATARPTGAGTATSQYGGNEISGGVRASLPLAVGSVAVVPMAGLRLASVDSQSIAEAASSGFALSAAAARQDSVLPYARVVVSRDFLQAGGTRITPFAALGGQYQAGDTQRAVALTAADSTAFAIGSAKLDRAAVTLGAGVAASQGNWSVFAAYGATLAGNWQQQEIDLGLRLRF